MNDWKKPGTPGAGTGALDGAHAQQISARLRQLYDTVQNEGILTGFSIFWSASTKLRRGA
ncbi:hypothetical protein V6L77_12475 [Pannonibacter sp. Pt2-lr]